MSLTFMLQSSISSLEDAVTPYGFAWMGNYLSLSIFLSKMSRKVTLSISACEFCATLTVLDIMVNLG
jgi:hypothetical protein